MSDAYQRFSRGPIGGLARKWRMKVGKIWDLYQTPCFSDRFDLWVGAFFYNIPEAMVTLHSHDCVDYAYDKGKGLWTQSQRRGGRKHGRGGTPRYRGEDRLPRGEGPSGGYGFTRWTIPDAIQKIGMKILIIDTALDLNINWMSTYLEWNGCGPPPAVNGFAEVAQQVYGNNGGTINTSLVAQGPSSGIAFGIGGFATTVPTQTIRAIGAINTGPFMTVPYAAPAGSRWRIFRTGGHEVTPIQESGTTPTTSGGTQAWAKASYTHISATGYTGFLELSEPGGDGSQGGIILSSPVTVAGDYKHNHFNAGKPDPCGKLPIITGR